MKSLFEFIRNTYLLLVLEILKLKRTFSLLVVFALPLLVVVFSVGMAIKSLDLSQLNTRDWDGWWAGVIALWCYFMLPLFVALITSTINNIEHRNHTWRLMLSLPVNTLSLYLAKLLLAFLLTLVAVMSLWLFGMLGGLTLGYLSGSYEGAFGYALFAALPKIAIASLPILVIQHAVSWRFSNMVFGLSLGVVATMGIVQLGSSEYWVWFPWSYMLMSSMGSSLATQQYAIELSILVALALFVVSLPFISSDKRAG